MPTCGPCASEWTLTGPPQRGQCSIRIINPVLHVLAVQARRQTLSHTRDSGQSPVRILSMPVDILLRIALDRWSPDAADIMLPQLIPIARVTVSAMPPTDRDRNATVRTFAKLAVENQSPGFKTRSVIYCSSVSLSSHATTTLNCVAYNVRAAGV